MILSGRSLPTAESTALGLLYVGGRIFPPPVGGRQATRCLKKRRVLDSTVRVPALPSGPARLEQRFCPFDGVLRQGLGEQPLETASHAGDEEPAVRGELG